MQAYGFDVILPQTANNEGMLTLPQIKSLTAHDRVLIWRGVGGRRLLHDTLVAKGVHIDAIEWYERTTPSDLYDNFSAILPTLPTTPNHAHVIISSEMAYQAWASSALRQMPRVSTVIWLAPEGGGASRNFA